MSRLIGRRPNAVDKTELMMNRDATENTRSEFRIERAMHLAKTRVLFISVI